MIRSVVVTTRIVVDILIGAGIFLIVAPVVFGAIAIAISLLQGIVLVIGSLVVSARRRHWTSWEPEWTIPDWFGDGF